MKPIYYLQIISILLLAWYPAEAVYSTNEKKQVDGTKDWSIVASYSIPGKASGLAWDGTFIYFGIYGSNGNHVYKFDPVTGENEFLFANPSINDSYGMTWDGSSLWITDHVTSTSVPAYALQLDLNGNILSQFDLPDHYMSGIAYEDDDFWVATYYPEPGTIYKVDNTGSVISQFTSPHEQPWDVCVQDEFLWIADYNSDILTKTDKNGNIIEEHPCENIKPSGVVYDGQFLWYVDGQLSSNSTLYKVDLQGGGTPQISLPQTYYNYGVVAVGDSAVWPCTITNQGTADLEISNVVIQNAVPVFLYASFPFSIEPGNSADIELIFKPTEAGTLNTLITVQCNDPVTPEVEVQVEGEAVFDGPHIQVPVTAHNYNNVRINATTRWYCEIINDGNTMLEITDIQIDDMHFFLDESVTFPININVLESIDIGLWFSPEEAINYDATATILHNDLSQDNIEVNLSGSGNDNTYEIGDPFWSYTITTSWDNSIKAIAPIEDVTGDGKQDLIICSEDDFVRCFNGNASGTGDMIWENEAGSVYGQNGLVTVQDINNDGYSDVILGLAWGVRAIKALSGKTGEQLWIYDTHIYGDGGWVYQVSAKYDYNGDDFQDVLASTGNDGNNTGPKRIFCLDGTDGNVIWDTYTDGPNFACIGVSDFTGDGLPDAIGGSSSNNELDGFVYGIDGSNGAIQWTFNAQGSSVWALEQLDDATGDGIKDIVAGDFGGNYYLIDAASGNAFYTGSAGSSIFLRFERLDDVNGNGYADIAFGYSGTNAIVIDGFSGENIWLTSLADKCWNIDRIQDISGDGINDLVAGTLYSNNFCYFINGVNGDILESLNFGEPVDAIAALPDINGDNSWEMVTGGRNGKVVCYSGGEVINMLQADFTADITQGYAPLTVEFTDLSSGVITLWEWDFESDGSIDSYDQDPIHTYQYSGQKTVTLIISNNTFSDTTIKEDYITVDTLVNTNFIDFNTPLIAKPNPFTQTTTILLNQDTDQANPIQIYDLKGMLIRELYQPTDTGKPHAVVWDGNDGSGKRTEPGVYLLKVQYNGKSNTLKLIRKD